MARGPLPKPGAVRRNTPTVPTTSLPAAGRKGRPPNVPDGYTLKKAGRAWWKWAWTTPQATAWDAGSRYTVGRRAQLEDDLASIDKFDPSALAEILGMEETEAIKQLGFVIGRLQGLAGGRLAVIKEMRELDKRLGLDPKALAELRWVIVAEEAEREKPPTSSRSRRGLRAIDGGAA